MPIAFSCDSCGKSFRVSDEYAGRIAKCKQCGNSCWVPSGAESAAEAGEPTGFPGLARHLAEVVQPTTALDTGTAVENASRWFARRFGIRPVWPATIAILGVVVGWLASNNRDRPEVQAVARTAFGLQLKENQPPQWSPDAIDTLAEIEETLSLADTWSRLPGDHRVYASESKVMVTFAETEGSPRMVVVVPKDQRVHSEAGLLMFFTCLLGGDGIRTEANTARLQAWIDSNDQEVVELHGATVLSYEDEEAFCFMVTEVPE